MNKNNCILGTSIANSMEPMEKESQDKLLSDNPAHAMITETIHVESKEMLYVEKDNSDSVILSLVPEFIDVKTELPNTDNEEHNLKTLGLVLSEPFSLSNICGENSEVLSSNSNMFDEQLLITNSLENVVPSLPNSPIKLLSKNSESRNNNKGFEMLSVNMQDVSKKSEKPTPKRLVGNTIRIECPKRSLRSAKSVSYSSKLRDRDVERNVSVKKYVGNARSKTSVRNAAKHISYRNKLPNKHSVKTNIPVADYVGNNVSIARKKYTSAKHFSNRNKPPKSSGKTHNYIKKVKSVKTIVKDNILSKIKPCSIVIEKTIANQMRPSDICKITQNDNFDNFIVCTKPQQNLDMYKKKYKKTNKIYSKKNSNSLTTSKENYLNDRLMLLDPPKESESALHDSVEENALNKIEVSTGSSNNSLLPMSEENDLNDRFMLMDPPKESESATHDTVEENILNKIDSTGSINSLLPMSEENHLNDKFMLMDPPRESESATHDSVEENILNKNVSTGSINNSLLPMSEENDLNEKFMLMDPPRESESPTHDSAEENILNKKDYTGSINSLLPMSEENYLNHGSQSMFLDPAKESESEIRDSVKNSKKFSPVKNQIKNNYSKILAKEGFIRLNKLSEVRQPVKSVPELGNITTFNKTKEAREIKNPQSQDSPLTQIMKLIKNNKYLTIEPTQTKQSSTNIKSTIEPTKTMQSVQNNKPLTFTPKQIMRTVKSNKALTIEQVRNHTPNSTIVENQFIDETTKLSSEDTFKMPILDTKTQLNPNISYNSTITENKLTDGTAIESSEDNSKKPTPDTKPHSNIEDVLDRAPPFIKEVFKCDSIRDGFVNEDLIFVLSLLPDMEEMADTDKLKFQLKVIETINNVLTDPLLES